MARFPFCVPAVPPNPPGSPSLPESTVRRGWAPAEHSPVPTESWLVAPPVDEKHAAWFDVARHSIPGGEAYSSSGCFLPSLVAGRPPASLSFAPLDSITASTLDLVGLRALAALCPSPEAESFLKSSELIVCPPSFFALFVRPPVSRLRRARLSQTDAAQLTEEWHIASKVDYGVTMGAFKVAKKNGLARLVVDARNVNEAQVPPPRMALPVLPEVAVAMEKHRFVFSIDACSFFYQFEVHEAISKCFVLRVNRARGSPVLLAVRRLAMGWKFAPAIAQDTANFILFVVRSRLPRVVFASVAWIDNFIFGVNCLADKIAVEAMFRAVCAEFAVALHPTDYSGSFLGLERRGSGHPYRLASSVVEKWRLAIESDAFSLRRLASIVGLQNFAAYLAQGSHRGTLANVARAISKAARQHGWDVAILPSAALLEFLRDSWQQLASAPVELLHLVGGPTIFSDASLEGFAFSTPDAYVVAGKWTFAQRIFLAELRTAISAISLAAQQHDAVTLYVDNVAVRYALENQSSTNPVANALIQSWLSSLRRSCLYRVDYVHTSVNPVDRFTRGGSFSFVNVKG